MFNFSKLICDTDYLGDFGKKLHNDEHEHLIVVHLGLDDQILRRTICTSQSGKLVELPFRDIVRDALNVGTSALVLAHNHPSGNPQPSRNDIRLTHRLADVLSPLSIYLRDHLILAEGQVVSMKDLSLI